MRSNIAQPLVDFWSELEDTVHPADKETMSRCESGLFRTEYPPPAFIGDIIRARVFVLMANGGYDAKRTIVEFSEIDSFEKFRERLREPRAWATPRFQRQGRLRELLERGKAVIVNALAYRSVELTKRHREIAEQLPSVAFHRHWLRSRLIPACGSVMVVVHRPALWGVSEIIPDDGNLVITRSPGTQNLPNWTMDKIDEFLEREPK